MQSSVPIPTSERLLSGISGFEANETRLAMRTFAQKPKATQQTTSAKSSIPGRPQSRQVNSLFHLQRTIGNQAVQRLLEADREDVKVGSTITETAQFGHDFSRIPVYGNTPRVIQAELTISTPGDRGEQEADKVAEQVMRMPDHEVGSSSEAAQLSANTTLQRMCEECMGEREEELEGKGAGSDTEQIDRRVASEIQVNSWPVNEVPPIVPEVLRSAGQPLDAETRAFMEPRFVHDFSKVRVHTDLKAAESTQAVNALAYTVGHNVVFDRGKYAPQTNEGQELIAHELTHVVQQSALAHQTKPISMESPNGDKFEKEAHIQAKRVTHGQTKGAIPIQPGSRQPILQRKADISKAPSSLPCLKEAGPGHPLGLNYKFAQSKADLSPADRADIADIVRVDYAKYGVPDKEYVHGFASVEGTQEFNWQLSCARAEAIKAELVRNGVPADKITTIAHGESTEFSATNLSENRRAIIGNLPVDQHQPVPAPPTPKPTTTPTKSYTFDMTINGCNSRPFVQRPVVNAVMAAYAKVITSGCIKSEALKEKILSEFDGLNVECEQDGDDCGMASRYLTQTVNLYPNALDPNSCGPLESTILHEIVHLTELLPTGTWNPFGHGILPDACEKSCFGVGSGDASKCK
jgi:outer membrane protein OmpA-like peptidoglycan-associated protein